MQEHNGSIDVEYPANNIGMGTNTKICRLCQVEKPIGKFSINRQNPDGHENRCKDCRNEQAKIRNSCHYVSKKRSIPEENWPAPPAPRTELDITHPHKCPVCSSRERTLGELYRHRETHDIARIILPAYNA